ncbi:carbon-nitrogen hydrolase family protein [Candidatus Riflebacteria bacterium]
MNQKKSFRLKVALLQMNTSGLEQDASKRKGEEYCRRAKNCGADLALFPEMWSIGYTPFHKAAFAPGFDVKKLSPKEQMQLNNWKLRAISSDDAYITHFQKLAIELDMAIALTYLEKWPEAPRDSVSVIDRTGKIILTYAKVHTCDFSMEAVLTPGEDFYVSSLATSKGEVKIGTMICYDREFPESARILMLKGAEIILTPNACPLEDNRLGQFRARAFENMVGVAMTNYAPRGHSVAFSPIAFDREGNSLDTCIVEAGEDEGVFIAEFDMDELRAYRKRETWGNAYRKPGSYAPLTSKEVIEPFIREDAKR